MPQKVNDAGILPPASLEGLRVTSEGEKEFNHGYAWRGTAAIKEFYQRMDKIYEWESFTR